MSRNLAFVPVRGGSKSIPQKNIKLFCGRPLVFWILNALQQSQRIEKIYVATDSDEIKAVVKSFSFEKVAVYDRKPENALDTSSTESVMLEFLDDNMEVFDDDTFVLAQATNPFTLSMDIDSALELYDSQSEEMDSLLTCSRVKRFFWNEFGKPLNYDFTNRPRRQDFSGILMENGAFYINKVRNIKAFKNRLTGSIGIYEMPEFAGLDIDEDDDWIIAESLMARHVLRRFK